MGKKDLIKSDLEKQKLILSSIHNEPNQGNSIDLSETGLITLEKKDYEAFKKFLDEPMFVINTRGFINKINGDPINLAELGLIVLSKSDLDEDLLNIYLPDDINEYQFSTLMNNCASDDYWTTKYRVFAKGTNDLGEYKYLDYGIMHYKAFIIRIYKTLLRKYIRLEKYLKREQEKENERTKQKI